MAAQQGQTLPFASSYAQPGAVTPPRPPPPPPAPAPAGVCILRQGSVGQLHLDGGALERAGFRMRTSNTSMPDMIITSPLLPAPLACIVASSTDPADSLDSSAFLDRCRAMAATFRTCMVALPYVLGAHPAVLQLLFDSRYGNKITVQHFVPGQDLTTALLQLLSGYLRTPDAQQLAADAESELLAAVTGQDALEACLAVLSS